MGATTFTAAGHVRCLKSPAIGRLSVIQALSRPESVRPSLKAAPAAALPAQAGQWLFDLTRHSRQTGTTVSRFNPGRTFGLPPVRIALTATPGHTALPVHGLASLTTTETPAGRRAMRRYSRRRTVALLI